MADAKITYKKDLAGTNEIMNAAPMQAVLLAVAEKAKAFAISISPVSDRPDADHYIDHFETSVHARGGFHGDRAEAVLANTSDHAVDVEWQAHGTKGHHVLGKTVDYIESEYGR